MTHHAGSHKRQRLYKRSFDYARAKELRSRGMTYKEIGEALGGIKPTTVARAIHSKRGAYAIADLNAALLERANAVNPRKDRCPTCQGWKSKRAKICHGCYQDRRLGVARVVPVQGEKSVLLSGVRLGRIVQLWGRYAVVERDPLALQMGAETHRLLHFWDGPSERIRSDVLVDVLPSSRVIVEDVA